MAAGLVQGPTSQQRRVRRAALIWALIAAGFYLGFIVLTLVRASR
jgi:hypothetical protein